MLGAQKVGVLSLLSDPNDANSFRNGLLKLLNGIVDAQPKLFPEDDGDPAHVGREYVDIGTRTLRMANDIAERLNRLAIAAGRGDLPQVEVYGVDSVTVTLPDDVPKGTPLPEALVVLVGNPQIAPVIQAFRTLVFD